MTEPIIDEDYFEQLKIVFVGKFNLITCGLPRRWERLRIGFMTGGHVTKRTGKEEYSAVCPILFFNFPNEEYSWQSPDDEPRTSYFFDLTGKRARMIASTLKRDFPCGFVPCGNIAPFQLQLNKMKEVFFNHSPRKKYLLPLYAEEFIMQIYEEHTLAEGTCKYEKLILALADEIHKDPAGKYDFNAQAEKLGITPIHYRRLFKAVIGLPPYEYLQQCRLLLAISLLKKDKSLQIQQISQMCGFGNSTEFSRFFKKETGVSPLAFCRHFFE